MQKLKNLSQGRIYIMITAVLAIFLFWHISQADIQQSTPTAEANVTAWVRDEPARATLGFTGDIMMHGAQIRSGYDAGTETYDFSSFFSDIADVWSRPDRMIANLETPIVPQKPYGKYPVFNAPRAILSNIRDAGVDIVALANNHILDQGIKGAEETRKQVVLSGLIPLGVYERPPAEGESPYPAKRETVNGIRIAYLNASYGYNHGAVPVDQAYRVHTLQRNRLLTMVDTLQVDPSVDAIVVVLHIGSEYQRQPTAKDRMYMRSLVSRGADIVIGAHPHVLQPIERYRDTAGNEGVIAYSLGNTISNQSDMYTDVGGVVEISLEKSDDQPVRIVDQRFVPTWVERKDIKGGKKSYRILTLSQAVDGIDTYSLPVQKRLKKYKEEYLDKEIPLVIEQVNPLADQGTQKKP